VTRRNGRDSSASNRSGEERPRAVSPSRSGPDQRARRHPAGTAHAFLSIRRKNAVRAEAVDLVSLLIAYEDEVRRLAGAGAVRRRP
jgi:hypothetical protein